MAPAIRASTAVPGIYKPVEIDGHLYVDGCLTATLDLATAIDNGATEILAIALGQPREEVAPRTLLGVLRRSLEVMSHATTAAMIEAAPRSARLHVVRPELGNESPWRLRNAREAERRFRQEAFHALEPLIDAHGSIAHPARPVRRVRHRPLPGRRAA
jgi:NTE family protein